MSLLLSLTEQSPPAARMRAEEEETDAGRGEVERTVSVGLFVIGRGREGGRQNFAFLPLLFVACLCSPLSIVYTRIHIQTYVLPIGQFCYLKQPLVHPIQ